jgi:hypothetical protein
MTEIDFTVLAERQYAALKGPRRKAMDEFLRDLARRGCGAISGRTGYRLAGQAPVSRLCDRHLHGEDRVIVAFESPDLAVVLIIAPHRAGHPRDVYANLWAACGLAEPPASAITKPPCCSGDGNAPLLQPGEITEIVERCRTLARALT